MIKLRNKILANLFKELKYIEAWGTGIERIDNLCKERGIKFIFEEKSSFVRCIFERKQNQKTDEFLKNINMIMDFLKRNGKITTNEVQKLTGLKATQSKTILYKLQRKGFIKKIGKTKGSYYISIKNKN